ncbi:MAG: hypothetical protein EP326_03015 [Deltaproteobacteria bacterium]|nr:MAG: hypothetical protein EP326_03015 [Deltaproteobacteria bacterium]
MGKMNLLVALLTGLGLYSEANARCFANTLNQNETTDLTNVLAVEWGSTVNCPDTLVTMTPERKRELIINLLEELNMDSNYENSEYVNSLNDDSLNLLYMGIDQGLELNGTFTLRDRINIINNNDNAEGRIERAMRAVAATMSAETNAIESSVRRAMRAVAATMSADTEEDNEGGISRADRAVAATMIK